MFATRIPSCAAFAVTQSMPQTTSLTKPGSIRTQHLHCVQLRSGRHAHHAGAVVAGADHSGDPRAMAVDVIVLGWTQWVDAVGPGTREEVGMAERSMPVSSTATATALGEWTPAGPSAPIRSTPVGGLSAASGTRAARSWSSARRAPPRGRYAVPAPLRRSDCREPVDRVAKPVGALEPIAALSRGGLGLHGKAATRWRVVHDDVWAGLLSGRGGGRPGGSEEGAASKTRPCQSFARHAPPKRL